MEWAINLTERTYVEADTFGSKLGFGFQVQELLGGPEVVLADLMPILTAIEERRVRRAKPEDQLSLRHTSSFESLPFEIYELVMTWVFRYDDILSLAMTNMDFLRRIAPVTSAVGVNFRKWMGPPSSTERRWTGPRIILANYFYNYDWSQHKNGMKEKIKDAAVRQNRSLDQRRLKNALALLDGVEDPPHMNVVLQRHSGFKRINNHSTKRQDLLRWMSLYSYFDYQRQAIVAPPELDVLRQFSLSHGLALNGCGPYNDEGIRVYPAAEIEDEFARLNSLADEVRQKHDVSRVSLRWRGASLYTCTHETWHHRAFRIINLDTREHIDRRTVMANLPYEARKIRDDSGTDG